MLPEYIHDVPLLFNKSGGMHKKMAGWGYRKLFLIYRKIIIVFDYFFV